MKINFFNTRVYLFLMSCLVGQLIFAEGFVRSTLVNTSSGYVAIEQLKKDDEVIFCDAQWSEQNGRVVEVHQTKVEQYIKIVVGGEQLCVAVDQKFYMPLQKQWVKARAIKTGDLLLSNGSDLVPVNDVVPVLVRETVYTITVDNYHNFCVSPLNINVHNMVPVAVIGVGYAFGLSAIECTAITGGLVASIGGLLLSCKSKKKISCNIVSHGGSSGGGGAMPPEDPDDKKKKRDEARDNYRPLTNQEARQKAKELGYKEDKNPPFNTEGKPAFKKSNNDWISPDKYGHKGGVWKRFSGQGRDGTYDINLTKRIGK